MAHNLNKTITANDMPFTSMLDCQKPPSKTKTKLTCTVSQLRVIVYMKKLLSIATVLQKHLAAVSNQFTIKFAKQVYM